MKEEESIIFLDESHIVRTTSDKILQIIIENFFDVESEMTEEEEHETVILIMGSLAKSMVMAMDICFDNLEDKMHAVDLLCESMKTNLNIHPFARRIDSNEI